LWSIKVYLRLLEATVVDAIVLVGVLVNAVVVVVVIEVAGHIVFWYSGLVNRCLSEAPGGRN